MRKRKFKTQYKSKKKSGLKMNDTNQTKMKMRAVAANKSCV